MPAIFFFRARCCESGGECGGSARVRWNAELFDFGKSYGEVQRGAELIDLPE
jgi:hypothetical protein